MRWIWIDRFTAFEHGKSATAVKVLTHAEDHFAEHYPGFPVMPAALLLEGLAQTGGILVGEANDFREKVVLAKVPKATFHRDARPGEVLTYTATLTTIRPEGAVVVGTITSGVDRIADAEIFFAHLDQNRSRQAFGSDNFVFSGELSDLMRQVRQLSAGSPTAALPAADT